MTKIDEEKRLVYGIATQEVKDRSDEVMDYNSTKPNFEKWSQDIEKATNGKSLGNVREMHSNKAAGKITELNFNDDNKAIEVCAKVVDDDSWNKVQEGVLTGFSIGGSYVKRWSNGDGTTRFTAEPAEISLVDLPCCPTATFDVIKADGATEQRKFKTKENIMDDINKTISEDFHKALASKDFAKAFSFEEIKNRLDGALHSQITTPFNCGYFWIKKTYPDFVIIGGDIDGDGDTDLYKVEYTMDDQGVITLGTISEVKIEFVPAVDEDDEKQMFGLPTNKAAKINGLGKGKENKDGLEKGKQPNTDGEKNIKKEFTEEQVIEVLDKTQDILDLHKSGKSISQSNMDRLVKLSHELNDMGAVCKCDKCIKSYAPEDAVKTAEDADLHKDFSIDELRKSMEGLADLKKGFEALKSENEALKKTVDEWGNKPLPGGAVMAPGMVQIDKTVGGTGTPAQSINETEIIRKMCQDEKDPMVKQALSIRLAMSETKKIYENQ